MVGRRIVIASGSTNGVDHSAEILARRLRDEGEEVIFTGPDQSVHQIVLTAIAEDAAAIGLPGADASLRSGVAALLAEHEASDIEILEEDGQ